MGVYELVERIEKYDKIIRKKILSGDLLHKYGNYYAPYGSLQYTYDHDPFSELMECRYREVKDAHFFVEIYCCISNENPKLIKQHDEEYKIKYSDKILDNCHENYIEELIKNYKDDFIIKNFNSIFYIFKYVNDDILRLIDIYNKELEKLNKEDCERLFSNIYLNEIINSLIEINNENLKNYLNSNYSYYKNIIDDVQSLCLICFNNDGNLIELNGCKHIFCKECIEYINDNDSCINCKNEFIYEKI